MVSAESNFPIHDFQYIKQPNDVINLHNTQISIPFGGRYRKVSLYEYIVAAFQEDLQSVRHWLPSRAHLGGQG